MSPEPSSLTVAQVCAILKTSCQANVISLSFHGLEVTFAPGQANWEPRKSVKTANAVATAEEVDQKTLEQDELAVKNQQAQEFIITDPLQFEELLEGGDLVDDGSGHGDSESTT